jgi:putrescine transport system ATP-binding protein
VAGFIGSINMVDAEITKSGTGELEVFSPLLGQPLRIQTSQNFPVGEKVSLAFRPEKISITREQPTNAANVLKGQVQDFGYFGKDSLYRIKLPTGHVLSVNTVNAHRLSEGEPKVTWDDNVFLSIDPKALMVFKGDA